MALRGPGRAPGRQVAPGELFRADAAALWDDLQDRTPLPIL